MNCYPGEQSSDLWKAESDQIEKKKKMEVSSDWLGVVGSEDTGVNHSLSLRELSRKIVIASQKNLALERGVTPWMALNITNG